MCFLLFERRIVEICDIHAKGLPFFSAMCAFAILFPFVLGKLNARKIFGRTTTVVFLAIFSAIFLCSVFAKVGVFSLAATFLLMWLQVWLVEAPASQHIFILALSACMWMKFHSYIIVNADLPNPDIRLMCFLESCESVKEERREWK